MFLAPQKDLKMFNINCLYCATLKKGKHQTDCHTHCSKSFQVSPMIRKSFVEPDGWSGGAGKTPPSEAHKRKKSNVCW